ncbi:hypothetical protein [Microbacterium sp. C7(2022)]|uniref:hypothetical protein n=1 Tax=Microbacterium sp. C7(2022) TaxID=2992759 RepID=UPI00237A9FBF|nr:hypothetical protein [Microbacterium sp. C7(2022)]MDE0547063.1 hypothetical protein [Microbacterium sp. C7(2022)]
MSEIDDITHQLEKLLADPMADAVSGHITIVAASAPTGRSRYQECALEVIARAPGVPDTTVHTAVVTSRKYWPTVGAVLPARVSVSAPENIDVDWDALAR